MPTLKFSITKLEQGNPSQFLKTTNKATESSSRPIKNPTDISTLVLLNFFLVYQ